MIHKPTTQISINGKLLFNFESIQLKQCINDHHKFKLVIDHDEIEALGSHTLDASKAWLGKNIVVTFDNTDFLGTITNINLLQNNGHHGWLEITGYSKTILLEQGNHTTSWLNKNLNTIFKDTTDIAALETQIKPKYKDALEYEAQYSESHFGFIQRLCKQHNEWLFWDGIKLVIGKPKLGKPIKLQYGRELSNINIGIKAKANSYNTFSYSSGDNTRHEFSTNNDVTGMNELGMESLNTSLEIFKTKVNTHSVARVKDKSQLKTSLKNKQAAIASDLHVLEADCNVQNLTVGSVIKVSSAKYLNKDNLEEQSYGEYIIIDIEHNATGQTTYGSHFKAIPSGLEILPEPNVLLPQAHSQIANIIDNVDPKGLGRVKAQLLWQKYSQTTAWLRVMTPDAGKSDAHGEIRGNLVIPEIGDQVVVGFRYGDPNRAYVMGSLYNGGNIAAGKENRNSLVSRMGSKMIMDDNDGSLQLTDKGGVNMKFDGVGNAVTQIAKTNTIGVGKEGESTLKMDAEGNITLDGKKSLKITIGESIFEMLSDGTIKVNGKIITVNAKTSTEIKAKNNHISGITKLDGGDVFIN